MTKNASMAYTLPRYFSGQVSSARRFHLRHGKAHGKEAHVIGAGLEHCRPDYQIDRSGFPYPILEFVVSGAGDLVINGKSCPLLPGRIFAYGRGVAHRMTADPEHPMVKYFLVLGGHGALSLLRRAGLAPGGMGRVSEPDRIRQIFDDLLDFGLSDRPDREAACAQTANYLMLKVSNLLMPAYPAAERAFATYERCRRYIETSFLDISSVADVARACHVDTAYLCRLFQRFGRERPFHYLQHLRMNHAMAQLQTTDRLIKEIAMELNFSDAANFTRAFRRWFDVPPQAIRNG